MSLSLANSVRASYALSDNTPSQRQLLVRRRDLLREYQEAESIGMSLNKIEPAKLQHVQLNRLGRKDLFQGNGTHAHI